MKKTGVVAVLNKVDGEFELREYPLPDPAPGTVLIKQELVGVCGTDIHMYHGRLPGIVYPIVLGHEFIGRIEKLGKGVEEDFLRNPVKPGDSVIVSPGVPCGKCYYCVVAKTPTTCVEGFAYGFFSDGDKEYHFTGGYGEYVYLHNPRTAFFKTELKPEVAVLAEPLTVAIHAVLRARIRPGDTVVVQGTGAVGLMTQVVVKLAGAQRIINIGGPKRRLEIARKFGADLTIDINEVPDPKEREKIVKENTIGRYGADVVFECTGVPGAVAEGLDMLRTSGTFVEVGHFTNAGGININPFFQICNKNVNLQGSWGGETEYFVRGIPVLERAPFPFQELVTHRLPLKRVNDIMKVPSQGYMLDGKEALKITIAGDLK